jgi:hypothetical protein
MTAKSKHLDLMARSLRQVHLNSRRLTKTGDYTQVPRARPDDCNGDILTVVPTLPFVNNGHSPSVPNRAGLF